MVLWFRLEVFGFLWKCGFPMTPLLSSFPFICVHFFFLLAFEASVAEFLFLAYCLEHGIFYLGMILYHHTGWPVLLGGDRWPRDRKSMEAISTYETSPPGTLSGWLRVWFPQSCSFQTQDESSQAQTCLEQLKCGDLGFLLSPPTPALSWCFILALFLTFFSAPHDPSAGAAEQ